MTSPENCFYMPFDKVHRAYATIDIRPERAEVAEALK
jgi:hypothetical protein